MFAKKDHLKSLLVLLAIITACNSISTTEVVDLQTEGRENTPWDRQDSHPRFIMEHNTQRGKMWSRLPARSWPLLTLHSWQKEVQISGNLRK